MQRKGGGEGWEKAEVATGQGHNSFIQFSVSSCRTILRGGAWLWLVDRMVTSFSTQETSRDHGCLLTAFRPRVDPTSAGLCWAPPWWCQIGYWRGWVIFLHDSTLACVWADVMSTWPGPWLISHSCSLHPPNHNFACLWHRNLIIHSTSLSNTSLWVKILFTCPIKISQEHSNS